MQVLVLLRHICPSKTQTPVTFLGNSAVRNFNHTLLAQFMYQNNYIRPLTSNKRDMEARTFNITIAMKYKG